MDTRTIVFSIRDLFLVTALIAVGIGWYVDRQRLLLSVDAMRQRVEDVELKNEFLKNSILLLERDVEGADEVTVEYRGEVITVD